jgi:hypothetical protein
MNHDTDRVMHAIGRMLKEHDLCATAIQTLPEKQRNAMMDARAILVAVLVANGLEQKEPYSSRVQPYRHLLDASR